MEEVKKQGMESLFVPYEIALALKELGFDEPCLGLYHNDKTLYPTQCKSQEQYYGQICSAPLYQQAFKWFREKYDLHAYVDSMRLTTGETVYSYVIEITDGEESDDGKNWKTYEEAELACLIKLIEIVKNK